MLAARAREPAHETDKKGAARKRRFNAESTLLSAAHGVGLLLRGKLFSRGSRKRQANQPDLQGALAARPCWQGSPFKRIRLRAVACRLTKGQRGRITAGNGSAKLNQLARSGAGWAVKQYAGQFLMDTAHAAPGDYHS